MKEIKLTLPKINEQEKDDSIFCRLIRKNYFQMWSWAQESKTDCFRLYDRELADYPLAIDYYAGRFCVQYFSRTRGDDEPAMTLVNDVAKGLHAVFGVSPHLIYWRTRMRCKKERQYEKIGASKAFFTVSEYGVKFKVNLVDYLDTGIFLDHRETRKIVASLCKGKRVLNLFAYTCSFSVHAAVMGALFTKSVDMSNTYTAWGRENFILNSIAPRNHEIVRADCLKFLDEEIRSGVKYDIVIIDPPTISRSKKMDKMFDVQVDYIELILKSLKLLSKGGVIFFSTNSRKFVFENGHFESCSIVEISDKTNLKEFNSEKMHRCWEIGAPR